VPIKIEDQNFTGFFGPDFDANRLRALSHGGRVEWLRFRFNLIFVKPFKGLVALDSDDCYVWLCVVNLLCGAVEALAGFEFSDRDPMLRFSRFVEKYFKPDWKQPLKLYDLKSYRSPATQPAEHLYKYFRCGLEHSLAIEWGGLRHREDGAPSYLHERNVVGDQLPSRRTQTVTRSLLYRKGGWPTYFPLGVYPSRWRGCPIDFALFAKWVGRWHPSHRALTTTSSCFRS